MHQEKLKARSQDRAFLFFAINPHGKQSRTKREAHGSYKCEFCNAPFFLFESAISRFLIVGNQIGVMHHSGAILRPSTLLEIHMLQYPVFEYRELFSPDFIAMDELFLPPVMLEELPEGLIEDQD